jgi:hypothetical protein
MSKTIQISDATFAKLGSLVIPFVDKTPEDVIERLIEHYLANSSAKPKTTSNSLSRISLPGPESRTPRERGTTVKIGDEVIHAATVPDLYEQAMALCFKEGYIDRLKPFIPFKTSNQRYLMATEAIHPRGNEFVVRVGYKGYFMEAHKSYKSAISDLKKLLSKIGVPVTYIG